MLSGGASRRAFLRSMGAAGTAFLLADVVEVREALAWAAKRMEETGPPVFRSLTPDQAAAIQAMMQRIIPSDGGSPGAAEAGAIHYLDRALEGFAASVMPQIEQGIKDLDAAAISRWPESRSFAGLTAERQDELLRAIEQDPFFGTVRTHTVIGTFAQPSYGGNRDHIGWALIGQVHEPLYQPPFGWYDAQSEGGR